MLRVKPSAQIHSGALHCGPHCHQPRVLFNTPLPVAGQVFIDATEFGDVLVTGAGSALKLPVVQGVEEPAELSHTTNDACGQAMARGCIYFLVFVCLFWWAGELEP